MRHTFVDGYVVADNRDGVIDLYVPVAYVDAGVCDSQRVAVVGYYDARLFRCVVVNETMGEKGLCRTSFARLHRYSYNGKRHR